MNPAPSCGRGCSTPCAACSSRRLRTPARPVLLLDDVHRIDRSSLAVIDHLLAHDALFVVATVNSDERGAGHA